jgi:hypothetical protein
MGKKLKHPDKALLDYLSGSFDQAGGSSVQEHLDSCGECSEFASLVRALKQEARSVAASASERYVTRAHGVTPTFVQPELPPPSTSTTRSSQPEIAFVPPQIDPYSKPETPMRAPMSGASNNFDDASTAHPAAEELASLIYSKSGKSADVRTNVSMMAHVALCSQCAGIVGEYSRAEAACADRELKEIKQQEAPGWVFKKINEWDESAFGMPKVGEDVISQTMLDKLLAIVRTSGQGLQEAIGKHLTHTYESGARPGLVPVIVLNRHGEAEGVEMFRVSARISGEHSLEHEEQSTRFHGRRLVAVSDAAAARPGISVAVVAQSCATFRENPIGEGLETTHYFLVQE